jgi:hypothetical protein
MPALGTQEPFVEQMLRGEKQMTIRAKGKHIYEAGQRLYFYKGLRTKHCEFVGWAILHNVVPLRITEEGIEMSKYHAHVFSLDKSHPATPDEVAQADGFYDFPDMRYWFSVYQDLPLHAQALIWSGALNPVHPSQAHDLLNDH